MFLDWKHVSLYREHVFLALKHKIHHKKDNYSK